MPKARAALGASLSAANVSVNVVCVPHLRHSEMDLPSSPLTTLKALQAHFGQIALMGFSPQHIRLEFSKDCRLSSLSARRVNKWLPRDRAVCVVLGCLNRWIGVTKVHQPPCIIRAAQQLLQDFGP